MKVKIIYEVCCILCGEITHNHFEYPVCLDKETGTSIYGRMEALDKDEFSCESCGAKFTILNKSYSDFRIKIIKRR